MAGWGWGGCSVFGVQAKQKQMCIESGHECEGFRDPPQRRPAVLRLSAALIYSPAQLRCVDLSRAGHGPSPLTSVQPLRFNPGLRIRPLPSHLLLRSFLLPVNRLPPLSTSSIAFLPSFRLEEERSSCHCRACSTFSEGNLKTRFL